MKALHIKYLGHSSFELITPTGKKIIVDPYQNSLFKYWFKQKFPKIRADMVIVTHDHFDHNAYKKIRGSPRIIKEPTIQKGKDCLIKLIKGKHAQAKKYNFYENNIAIIEIGKIRICHWGDNDANITKLLEDKIGRIDVLMIPVDESEHILTLQEVSRVIKKLSPKIVIPMHYFSPGLTTKSSNLKSISNWLKEQKNTRKIPREGKIILTEKLPKKREFWVFKL